MNNKMRQRHWRLLVAVVTVLATSLAFAPSAFANDGDILDPNTTNMTGGPYQTTISGLRYVTATISNVIMDCPVDTYNCSAQFRLANKCTGFWCTWYEQTPSTYTTAGTKTLGARRAGGNHYWKIQSRTCYTVQATRQSRHDFGAEFGAKGEGSGQGIYRNIVKAIAKTTWVIRSWVTRTETVTATAAQTTCSSWLDVDQSPGTIFTN